MNHRIPLSEQEAPRTPVEAARLLWQVDQEKDAVTAQLCEVRRRIAALRKAHRLAYARAFLSGQGTVEDRKRATERDTIDEWFAVEAAEQELEACRDRLRDLAGRAED